MPRAKYKNILIVDDSEVICNRLCSFLSEIDNVNVVGQAHNISEGYKLYGTLKPDIIILDIRLSGENGISLLKKIREEDSEITILILTNYPYSAYRICCMGLGADYFFDKSTELQKITDLISAYY
jgi:DNA-binding NarL/FixJ family response regulator